MSTLTREEIESALEDAAPYGDLADVPVNAKWLRTVLKAALQSLTPAPAWMPISEAPKDGTDILAIDSSDSMAVIHWYDIQAWSKHEIKGEWTLTQQGAYATSGEWYPEHWQPLPPSPHTGLEKTK